MVKFSRQIGPLALAIMLVCLVTAPAWATAPTLPDIGVDLADYVPVVAASFGALLAVIIASALAFLVLRKGWRSMSRALG